MQQLHCEAKRGAKEAEELNDEMSRVGGYGRVELTVINFVPLNVYFDHKKIK